MKKGYLYVLLSAFLWGTLPVFCRFAYSMGADSLSAAGARAYISALIFIIIFLFRGTFKELKMRDIPFYILYGLVGVGGTFYFYMLAIERLSTAMASVLLYTAPAFVIIFSRIFYKEKITPVKGLALFGTLIGSALVVRAYEPSSLAGNIPNIIIGLLAGICYSMVTILGKIAKTKGKPETNSGLMLIFGSLVFFFVKPPHTIIVPDMWVIVIYVLLAVVGSVLPYSFYLKGLGTGIDGSYASVVATIEPVVATVLCSACFREGIEVLQIVGIVIVLLSIFAAVTDKS